MADFATNPQTSELDNALNQLEVALVDAGRSMATVRRNVAQLTSLVDTVRALELAMSRARESLAIAPAAPTFEPASPAPLRAVPPQPEASYAPPAPPAEPETTYYAQPASPMQPEASYTQPAPQPDYMAASEPLPEEPAFESAATSIEGPPVEVSPPVSHCLRLGVASKVGSLDLKAVDGSVNENPAVVDVALLDYDGRKATLKLWINGAADPAGVRDALLGSLRRRLGDEREAEVEIDFEGAA